MTQLSFIIPVYNAARYIEACVDSCIRFATGAKLTAEIVLVDDGSTDESAAVIKKIASRNIEQEKGVSIKVVGQANQGVSAARNTGLSIATGKWVWFVDADDYLCSSNIGEEKAEGWKLKETDNFVVTGFVWDEAGAVTSYSANEQEVPYNLWRCWFRRDLIETSKLIFTPGRKYAEDQEFLLKYLLHLEERDTVAIKSPLYYYTMRPGSAMTKPGAKRKKIWDLMGVILAFSWEILKRRKIDEAWVWRELKRMGKTLWVQTWE